MDDCLLSVIGIDVKMTTKTSKCDYKLITWTLCDGLIMVVQRDTFDCTCCTQYTDRGVVVQITSNLNDLRSDTVPILMISSENKVYSYNKQKQNLITTAYYHLLQPDEDG